VRRRAGDDDVLEMPRRRDCGSEFRQQLLGHHQHAGAAVREHEAIVVLGHQRVNRNRDHARFDRAEECRRPVDGVEKANEYTFFRTHAELAQHMAKTFDPVGELGIGIFAAMIDEGDLVGAAAVEIARKDIGGEIVVARHRGRAWRSARLTGVHPCCFLVRQPPLFVAAPLCRWCNRLQWITDAAFSRHARACRGHPRLEN